MNKSIQEELLKSASRYARTMRMLSADAPIEVLCLEKKTQKILLQKGYLRVYDLLDVDLAKVEGISPSDACDLTARVGEFLSIL